MAFDIKKEFSLLPNKYFTYDQIKAELRDICWKCRRDLAPGFGARELFEVGVSQGLIRAGQGDEYLVNVRRVSAHQVQPLYMAGTPMGVGGHINLSGNVVGVLNSTGRGSGRTTRQLQALPIGGWFFYKGSRQHMKDIKAAINRPDIVLKLASTLKDYYQYHGCVISGFDVGHSVLEPPVDCEIIDGAQKMLSCLKPWLQGNPPVPVPVPEPETKSTICPCGIHRLDCDYHK